MKRELPVYNIEGTDFIVDVANLQLMEKANPQNVIPVLDMMDTGDGYEFEYSPKIKNMPSLSADYADYKDITRVKIPELVMLDPVGMAEKYSYPLEAIPGKKDIDIMVDQKALKERLSGRLPTVDIMGLTFYVDTPMDMLRPKDDFLSNGIVFSRIEDYYDSEKDAYTIPYNPKTHEFQELDYNNITSIPKGLVPVSFPHESILDPVGFNRAIGLEETTGLKRTNLHAHFESKVVDWKDTGVEQIIRINIKEQLARQRPLKQINDHKASRRQRKGPRQ